MFIGLISYIGHWNMRVYLFTGNKCIVIVLYDKAVEISELKGSLAAKEYKFYNCKQKEVLTNVAYI